ncbi:unnamed protein product, partial [Scytosiphon promiscuus]
FRQVADVCDVGLEERRGGLIRTWEDCTPGNEIQLKASDVSGLAEVYTLAECAAGEHGGVGDQGAHNFPWERFVGEGFVIAAGKKRRRRGAFTVSESPWSKEGSAEKPLFVLRRDGVHLNDTCLPFFSAPIVFYNDAFNAHRLGNKHSIGGSYFGWPWRTLSVQRLKHQTHPATFASGGACCPGEIGLQCEILGLLQQGCVGRCRLTDGEGTTFEQEVFVRGGLLMLCGDGPGRSKCLGGKGPNHFSTFPCPYCMVRQVDDDTGGDLGNPRFDIEKHKRTWGEITAGFTELEALADDPDQQTRRSLELGLLPPDASGLALPLYNAMHVVPTEHVPVERLHFDALGQCSLCQGFNLGLLSTRGEHLVSAIMGQESSLLYPPGTEKLKNIVTNYISLTGSDKWTLQSIMLLVFRIILQDVPAMKRNMKARALKDLVAEWGTHEKVLEALRKLIQMTSHLSFAVRAPSYTDQELQQLELLARDVVGVFSGVLGRTGSRPTLHSILHTAEAIRLHGEN